MTKKLTKVAMTTALAAAAIVPAVVATPAQAAEAEVTFAKAYYTTANGTAAFEAGKLAGVIGATNDTKVTYAEGSNGEVFPMSAFSAYLAVNPTATTDEVLTALSKAGKALSADQVKALDVKEGQVEGGKVTVDPTAVQKTALNEAIAKAEASPKAAELKDAIAAAKAVAAKADATQAEVDAAVKALNEAIAEAEAVKELKVESVSAINNIQVKVVFNQEVDKASAETTANYALGTSALVQDDFNTTLNANEATAKLQDDKKTVILTFAAPRAQQAKAEIGVSNVRTADNTKTVVSKLTEVTFGDTTLPTISKVSVAGNKAVTLTFSEPVARADVKASQFKINGNALTYYGGANLTFTPVLSNGNQSTSTYVTSVTITVNNTLPSGDNTISFDGSVNAIHDAAGFPIANATNTFTVGTTATAPTFEVLSAVNGVVKVKFSELVNASTITPVNFGVTISGGSPTVTGASVDSTDKSVVNLAVSGLVEGAAILSVNANVQDAYGNSVSKGAVDPAAAKTLPFTVTKDTVKPVIEQVLAAQANGTESEQHVRLLFSEAVDTLSAQNSVNYVIKDANGKTVATSAATSTNRITGAAVSAVSGQNKVVTLTLTNKLPGGTYTVEVKNVKDVANNVIDAVSKSFTVTDKTAPTLVDQDSGTSGVQAAVANTTDKTLTVYFSEPMAVTGEYSILNTNNYRIAGNILSNATITAGADNKSAIIQYSTVASVPTATTGVEVLAVKDANGVLAAGLQTTVINSSAVTTGPKVNKDTVKAYTTTDKDYITFETDKPLASVDLANTKTVVKVSGGAALTVTSYAINGKQVTLNFAKGDLATGQNVTLELTATAGADAAGAPIQALFNGSAGTGVAVKDGIAPTVTGVARNGNKVDVTFSENLKTSVAGTFFSDFVIDNGGTTVAPISSEATTNTLTLTFADSVTLATTGVTVYPVNQTTAKTVDVADNAFAPTALLIQKGWKLANILAPTYSLVQVGEGDVTPSLTTTAATKEFTSSDTVVATVNATTGVISPLSAGTTTISYTGKDANGNTIETGSVVVTVHAVAATTNPSYAAVTTTGGAVTPTGLNALATDKTFTINSTGTTGTATIDAGTGELTATVAGAIVVDYVGKDANGVVIEKGSVTVNVAS